MTIFSFLIVVGLILLVLRKEKTKISDALASKIPTVDDLTNDIQNSPNAFGEFWISFVKSSTVGIFEAKASEILVFSFLRTNRINPTTIRKENMVI